MRLLKELLDSMMTKYELLPKENKEMKNMFAKYDQIMETNKETKKELGNIEKKMKTSKSNVWAMKCNWKISKVKWRVIQ